LVLNRQQPSNWVPNASLLGSGSVVAADPAPDEAEKLARKAQAGCQTSFESLVALFENRIYHFLLQMTRNPHDAEDLTQITFLKAFKNIRGFKSPHAFAPWLFTIAKRSALNHFRGARETEELTDDARIDSQTPFRDLEKKEESHGLWALAANLPQPQAEALWLRYGEDFSIAEIATVMGTNQLRVRVLLHRARARLSTLLDRSRDGASKPERMI
jgi:RNA polymerase sigma-70 factor (ECF subfamily)